MADQSDDIKNLFTRLGLDPSHYQQIRATTAVDAAAELLPCWALLQPATLAVQPVAIVPPATVMSAAPAMPPPRKPEPLPPDAMTLSSLSAALLGAAQDIVRAETAAQPELEEDESAAPSALASALSQVSPAEGLQSLFQSVKESQAAVYQPSGIEDAPTERPTVRLPGRAPKVASRSMAGADLPARQSRETTQAVHQAQLREMPQARSASRLGPRPGVTLKLDPIPAVPPVAEGRLRFTAPPERGDGESLPDVFRRLARHPQG